MTTNTLSRLMFPAVLWIALAAAIVDAQASEWSATGDLNEARSHHTMTLLPDGQVLAAGGYGTGGTLGSAELYDPETGSWSATGSLLTPLGDHTATLLPNGLVLVAGGSDGTVPSLWYQYPSDAASAALATAQLYDPATGAWQPTGSLNTPRYGHRATLLANGRVLVTGGCCDSTQGSLTALTSAELYDPVTETWTPVASMSVARDLHSATLLADGSVLVAGGQYPYPGPNRGATVAAAEIYTFDPTDPSAGTWQATGSMLDGRSWHGAATLPDGIVLVTGGYPGGCCAGLQTAEAYEPVQKTWRSVGAMTQKRFLFTATPLADGTVLATGGYGCCWAPASVWPTTELYDPATQGWTSEENMGTSRFHHAAVLMPDGSVLVAGGITDPDPNNGSSDYRVTTEAEVFAVSDSPPANQSPTAAFNSVCTGLDCTFTDQSSDSGGTINGRNWNFGDGDTDTSSAPNPNHTYAADGTYTVTLTVTDDDGANDTASQSVTVVSDPPAGNQGPTAAFTSAVCTTGLPCDFMDRSSDTDGTIGSWSWDFGDGNNSTEQSPSHTYTVEGTNTVTLTVTDDGGATDSVSQSVAVSGPPPVNQAPTAAFNPACTDLECTFTDGSSDTDGTIASRSWDFGDGNGSTLQNPSHTYAAGTYTVTLTVTDDDGAYGTVAHDVTVTSGTSPPVEASFVSIAAEDGWVRESGESSGVGGSRNTGGSGSKAIRMGDDRGDRQYKSILSFDTSSIPDGATITRARLELMRGGNSGKNPFNTHGTCYVDIKAGGFSGNAALQTADFQDPADVAQVATVSIQGGSGTLHRVDLGAAGNSINKAGRTQLRLYFSSDDNDDRGTDLAGFYSADNSIATKRPRLIVEYQE